MYSVHKYLNDYNSLMSIPVVPSLLSGSNSSIFILVKLKVSKHSAC